MFCKDTKGDYSSYVQQLFRVIVQAMNDVDEQVVLAAWDALDSLVKVKIACVFALYQMPSVDTRSEDRVI